MDETAVTIGTASEIESTIDYEVAPPAAPYEVESGASTGGSIQQTFEQLLRFLSDPSNYRNLFESIQTSAQEFLGEERYATVAENALPVICIFVWTIIIYLIAYIKGRDSKESHLVGEMMKTQAEIFKIEKDLTRYDTQLKKGKINGSKWNTRILLFMIVGEILMVLYIYFIHRKYFYHPVKETFSLHNLPPELACVVFFIIMMVWKRLVSCFYNRSISRAQKNIKKDFERYAPLKTKYDKLMEENNHSQVMKTMANIDRIKNSYTKKPQPQRVTQHKPVPKPDASKMQHIPAPTTPQQFQTPQLRNRAQPQGQYTAPLPVYTKQAPPISPYIPPDIKNSGSSGIWGTAIGLISGNSSDVEDAICEFCGENNGPWPKDEIKQFECRKCKKFNGAKRSHSKPEKKEPPPEVPEEDEEEVNKKED